MKKDHLLYSTNVEGQSFQVFVTKLYKLVKIRDKSEYVFDFEDLYVRKIKYCIKKIVFSICRTHKH